MLELVIVLLCAFQVKHFMADYLLQTPYMLNKFAADWSFVMPLVAHCSVHALITACIASAFVSWQLVIVLVLFDFVIHFTMDRIKASPNMLGRWDVNNAKFWHALGLDQMVHHLTHYAIIYVIVTDLG